jgi:hypothetical protein
MISSFTHPTHGPLTVHERIGRSRRCTKPDGTSLTLSSKEINKLTNQAVQSVLQSPDAFLASAGLYLAGMDDTSERVRVARTLWQLAEGYLQS